MTSLSKKSKLSLNSVKSVAEKVPKTRACPWVAQWFTIPQAVVKVLQFGLSVPAVVLLFMWRSHDVTIATLNTGDINYRNTLYSYIGISILSAVYSFAVASVGIVGMKLPPLMQSVFSIVILLTWLLGAPMMSASVEHLSHNHYILTRNIDTLYLLIATALGFASLAVCLIDVLLGFQSIRNIDQESKEFTRELSQSKSVIMAVHSGQSFAEAKQTRSSNKSISKQVDETSPLKSHEVSQGTEDQ